MADDIRPALRVTDKRRVIDPQAAPVVKAAAPAIPPDLTDGGRFLAQCGHCGRVLRVKNLTVRQSKDPCARCVDLDEDPDLHDEAGWCGCGAYWTAEDGMRRYLQSLADRTSSGTDWPGDLGGLSDLEYDLLARIADGLGWIEHGTSVNGSWLTEDGKETLHVLRQRGSTD